jgi:hypothetical protein
VIGRLARTLLLPAIPGPPATPFRVLKVADVRRRWRSQLSATRGVLLKDERISPAGEQRHRLHATCSLRRDNPDKEEPIYTVGATAWRVDRV